MNLKQVSEYYFFCLSSCHNEVILCVMNLCLAFFSGIYRGDTYRYLLYRDIYKGDI